jgi:hypothetical protein
MRHGLPAVQGRGFDGLPDEVKSSFEGALVGSLDAVELRRAFRAAVNCLLNEVREAEPTLAARLREPLIALSA